MSKGQGHCYYK